MSTPYVEVYRRDWKTGDELDETSIGFGGVTGFRTGDSGELQVTQGDERTALRVTIFAPGEWTRAEYVDNKVN